MFGKKDVSVGIEFDVLSPKDYQKVEKEDVLDGTMTNDDQIAPNPILTQMGDHINELTRDVNINRPKNFVEEIFSFSHWFYVFCSPKMTTYNITFTPIIITILWLVFLLTVSTYGQQYCPDKSQVSICGDAFYNLKWGGMVGELVKTEIWRLVTAGFHHINFIHLGTNSLMILIVGWMMEPKYGSLRLWIIFIGSVIGGYIFTWLFYPLNYIVIGASGGCYGLLFLIFADCILNWETVRFRWFLVCFIGTCTVITMIIEAVFANGVATIAHLGGGVSSLWISILILPNFYYRTWERYLTLVCLFCFIVQFVILPLVAYLVK